MAALTRSAEKAQRREGIREADRFYARALEIAGDEHPELEAEIRFGRARAQDALGNPRGARSEYEQVAEAALELGRRDLRCSALLALANSDQRQGLASEARPRLAEAERLAAELEQLPLEIRTLFESANLRSWFEADHAGAAETLRQAQELTDSLGDLTLRIEVRMRLGSVLFNTGDLAGAERALMDAATLAGETGSVRDDARISSLLAYVKYFRDPAEAERLALQALEWLERVSDSYLELQNLRVLAKCALLRGDALGAEEYLGRAVPIALEGRGWVLTEVYRYLVEAVVEQGRIADARELVDFASRDLPEEDPYARAALLLAGESSRLPQTSRQPPRRASPRPPGSSRRTASSPTSRRHDWRSPAHSRAWAKRRQRGSSSSVRGRCSREWKRGHSSTSSTRCAASWQRGPASPAPAPSRSRVDGLVSVGIGIGSAGRALPGAFAPELGALAARMHEERLPVH